MNNYTERYDIVSNIIKYNPVYRVDLTASGRKNRDYADNISYYSIGDGFKMEIVLTPQKTAQIIIKDKTFNRIYGEISASTETGTLLKTLENSLRNTQKHAKIVSTSFAHIAPALNQQLMKLGPISKVR